MSVYQHYLNKKLYVVRTELKSSIQEGGNWVPAVTYYEKGEDPLKVYTRSAKEFKQKFSKYNE